MPKPKTKDRRPTTRRCRKCGCTDGRSCVPGGCWWVPGERDLCSSCLDENMPSGWELDHLGALLAEWQDRFMQLSAKGRPVALAFLRERMAGYAQEIADEYWEGVFERLILGEERAKLGNRRRRRVNGED